MHKVPIQCEDLKCPKCDVSEHLTYHVRQIDNEKLTFTVVITCRRCHRERTLSKVLSKLLSLVKISIGPVGISANSSNENEGGEE